MTVELRPLGVRCNLSCTYCYQEPQRAAASDRGTYDIEAMKAAVIRQGGPFVLFGGEPLLLPMRDLEELLAWGAERYGSTGLQTNGVLISDDHIRLFRTYAVRVGVSIDGPGELNGLRRQGSPERTLAATERTLANIARLVAEYEPPGLIVTLHRLNAVGEQLDQLLKWTRSLDALGIRSMRLHPLEVDSEEVRPLALSEAENVAALHAFAALAPSLVGLRFDVFTDIERGLRGLPGTSCTWNGCDPYTTEAVRGVEGDGRSSNCGRTNKDGVDFLKADRPGYERYVALARAPQAHGGCAGCRFFLACRGQCPGTALGGDWRNRSEHCGVWKAQFEAVEARLVESGVVPVSLDPRRREAEARLVAAWRRGRNRTTAEVLEHDRPLANADARVDGDRYRLAWAGVRQRERWAAPLVAAQRATWRVTLAAAAAGVTAAAIASPAPEDAVMARDEAVALGLHVRALRAPGGPVRMAVGRRADVLAIAAGGPAEELLPACCRDAASKRAAAGASDHTWVACGGTSGACVDLDGSMVPNLLLRGIGLDVVGHVPCAGHCAASAGLVEERVKAARHARTPGLEALLDILAWSVEWSALHGVAEVKTPVFRAVHATDYTAGTVRLRRKGGFPEDPAAGLGFPYRRPRKLLPVLVEGASR